MKNYINALDVAYQEIKNYINGLDVACQQIKLGDETKNDVTTKGEIRSNREQGKLTKEVRRRKEIHVDANIVDIIDENDTTPLSQL